MKAWRTVKGIILGRPPPRHNPLVKHVEICTSGPALCAQNQPVASSGPIKMLIVECYSPRLAAILACRTALTAVAAWKLLKHAVLPQSPRSRVSPRRQNIRQSAILMLILLQTNATSLRKAAIRPLRAARRSRSKSTHRCSSRNVRVDILSRAGPCAALPPPTMFTGAACANCRPCCLCRDIPLRNERYPPAPEIDPGLARCEP